MFLLNLVSGIHLINELFVSTYVFIFNKKYDIYYIIYILLIITHWIILNNECVISYIEKKLINKDYILGDQPFEHPYHNFLPIYIINLLEGLKFLNLIIIFVRNRDNKLIIFIMLIIFGYILFNLANKLYYFNNKNNNEDLSK
jgi:hypothetical protein